ncbi:MAG TPA: hypothetical protein VNO21_02230 [Polyangiaceae bacterium]|nr:hypothetical protein [Polyangiaceae bacterium]
MFLALMVIGIVGLLVMALPALGGSGHITAHHVTTHVGHHVATHHVGDASPSHGTAGSGHAVVKAEGWVTQFIPSPRAVFSFLALYGAFGNAFVRAMHLTPLFAAGVAVLPAFALERWVVARLWNLLFRSQGNPSSPLEQLLFSEAKAVTSFRNGRGIVSVVRDGRVVQFVARLPESQADVPIRVGETLRVEEVDAANERLTVGVVPK